MPKGIRFVADVETVKRLYVDEHLTAGEVGKRLGFSACVVYNTLRKNNIPVRNRGFQKKDINIAEMKRLYVDEHLSSLEVARRLGVTFPTILSNLRLNGVATRENHSFNSRTIKRTDVSYSVGEIKSDGKKQLGEIECPVCGKTRWVALYIIRKNGFTGRCRRCSQVDRRSVIDANLVDKLYHEERLGIGDIAKRLHVNKSEIRVIMERNGIQRRRRGESNIKHVVNKGTVNQPIIGDVRRAWELGLIGKSFYVWVVCDKCGAERWEVKSRVSWYPLCKPCAMKQSGLEHSGEKSVWWFGGVSFEPYSVEFNEALKEEVRKRDGYACRLCLLPQNGKRLSIHHIDYDKKHISLRNLISLCHHCHSKTNHNRQFWAWQLDSLLNGDGSEWRNQQESAT